MQRSGTSTSDRIEPVGIADEGKLSRNSLSVAKQIRSEQPASAKNAGRARLQPIDEASSALGRPNDIRAFMGRAARLRHNFDDAN
jgi:hypothetical protein